MNAHTPVPTAARAWSPQQQAAIDFATGDPRSLVVNAGAGTGKTTLIFGMAAAMPGNSLYLVFNRKNAAEAKGRLQEQGIDFRQFQASTLHGMGMAVWKRHNPDSRVVAGKVAEIVREMLDDGTMDATLAPYEKVIVKLVGLAKQAALGIVSPIADKAAFYTLVEHFDLASEAEDDDDGVRAEDVQRDLRSIVWMAQKALQRSYRDVARIDFADMIVMPIFHRARFLRFRNVIVDESQDTNEAGRALVRCLVAPGGRTVWVGDRRQAIYGFAGASADGMDAAVRDWNAAELPLSVTYRCPKAVVAFANRWVPAYEAHPDAPEGSVSTLKWDELLKRPDLGAGSAVLSRNTRPLVAACFAFLRRGVPCRIEGRAVGDSLVSLATRWKRVRSIAALEDRLRLWIETEQTRAEAANKPERAQDAEDRGETLIAICEACRARGQHDIADVVARIGELFADDVSGMLVLSTIHRAKGLEWDTVYWLDRKGTLPSQNARQPWQRLQEDNLCYVAATRAKRDLVEVTDLPQPKRK